MPNVIVLFADDSGSGNCEALNDKLDAWENQLTTPRWGPGYQDPQR